MQYTTGDLAGEPDRGGDLLEGIRASVRLLPEATWLQTRTPAWIEHIPFAHWLIGAIEPSQIVELGTHFGNSYFAFCEAVERLGLPTRCYAIDTWLGDEHSELYGEEVFTSVQSHNAKYAGFSTLLRTTFDEALPYMLDGSTDLLHIDGLHTYEAVKHDFESWLPKLSDRAVVIMHDTNVRKRQFGVFRLWAELTERYPHFEFLHGCGLGVLGVGAEQAPSLKALYAASADSAATGVVREAFWRAAGVMRLRTQLAREREEFGRQLQAREQALQAQIHRLTILAAEKEAAIQRLTTLAANVREQLAQKTQEIDRLITVGDERVATVTQLATEVSRAREQAQAVANEARLHVEAANNRAETLQRLLTKARRNPHRVMAQFVSYGFLYALARTPLPQSITARWARSAAKRNPRRREKYAANESSALTGGLLVGTAEAGSSDRNAKIFEDKPTSVSPQTFTQERETQVRRREPSNTHGSQLRGTQLTLGLPINMGKKTSLLKKLEREARRLRRQFVKSVLPKRSQGGTVTSVANAIAPLVAERRKVGDLPLITPDGVVHGNRDLSSAPLAVCVPLDLQGRAVDEHIKLCVILHAY
jgi:hypothetical protein